MSRLNQFIVSCHRQYNIYVGKPFYRTIANNIAYYVIKVLDLGIGMNRKQYNNFNDFGCFWVFFIYFFY